MALHCVVLFQTQYAHSGRNHRFLIQTKMKNKSLAAWALQLFFSITFSISVLLCTLLRAARISWWFKHCAESQKILVVSDYTVGFVFAGKKIQAGIKVFESHCKTSIGFAVTAKVSAFIVWHSSPSLTWHSHFPSPTLASLENKTSLSGLSAYSGAGSCPGWRVPVYLHRITRGNSVTERAGCMPALLQAEEGNHMLI